jgi:hypothetical protein
VVVSHHLMNTHILMNHRPGDDVIVPPSVTTEAAKKKFGNVREVKPYDS